jgi:hypothetical protein
MWCFFMNAMNFWTLPRSLSQKFLGKSVNCRRFHALDLQLGWILIIVLRHIDKLGLGVTGFASADDELLGCMNTGKASGTPVFLCDKALALVFLSFLELF